MSGTSSPGCGGPSLAVSHHCVFGWFFFGFFSRPLSARVGMRECKSRFKLEPIKMDKKRVGQRRTLCESLLESLIPCH